MTSLLLIGIGVVIGAAAVVVVIVVAFVKAVG